MYADSEVVYKAYASVRGRGRIRIFVRAYYVNDPFTFTKNEPRGVWQGGFNTNVYESSKKLILQQGLLCALGC